MKIDNTNHSINLLRPGVNCGSEIWKLVRNDNTLDLNSAYCYLMLCKYFSDTCVIARINGRLIGFVTAYHLPDNKQTLFIWQICIIKKLQGNGIGTDMLLELFSRDCCSDTRYIEATVTPSNTASRILFKTLAEKLNTQYKYMKCFERVLFPSRSHEAERLIRLGPFEMGLNQDVKNYLNSGQRNTKIKEVI